MIEMDEMKGRGKRGLLRVVFGRTMFFLLFIALQLAFFFWIYVWLDNKYQAWGYGSFALISAILTIHILNEKQNASFKMAWLILSCCFRYSEPCSTCLSSFRWRRRSSPNGSPRFRRGRTTFWSRTRLSMNGLAAGAGEMRISAII